MIIQVPIKPWKDAAGREYYLLGHLPVGTKFQLPDKPEIYEVFMKAKGIGASVQCKGDEFKKFKYYQKVAVCPT